MVRLAAFLFFGVEPNIRYHESSQDRPKQSVSHRKAEIALEPEKLVGVQNPSHQENQSRGHDLRSKLALFAELKVRRQIADLHHEVFPIDIDPAPEIADAARQEILPVGFWQVVSEQMEHPDYDVKLARYL